VYQELLADEYPPGRGIGLAVTKILLQEFDAAVVAISRTETPELSELKAKHSSLLVNLCDV
jgi:NAD(P)-dependent dehydrogenase (short-subunit alcohol dehydrogenase family)